LWEERLKNFRSIRRGLEVVVTEIDRGRFGNVYKGWPLGRVPRHAGGHPGIEPTLP